MFKSIRWKFITVYFLLVFIAMVIVGVFIIEKFEVQQLDHITSTMERHIEMIINTSSFVSEDDWMKSKDEIQRTANDWPIDNTETLYIIVNSDIPTIVASSSKNYEKIIGQNALVYKFLDPSLILKALDGEKSEGLMKDYNEDNMIKHLAYPVYDEVGKVKGVLYMTSDLEEMYKTIDESKIILTKATLLALCITVFLGFLIASSITEPIRDVTVKAEQMAKGDFDQFVEVKSDDEIGQLASMFNYLTLKLKETISEMDLERSKLDTIFSYMEDGVLAIDTKWNIIHANPVALKILKLEDKDINNIKYDDVMKKIDNRNLMLKKAKENDDFDNSLEGNEIVEIDSSVYNIRYAPFRNERNGIGGLIIVFQDITEQHKLDNMRKEFVANVSHELKTPITTIKSYAETLLDNGMDEEISYQFLTVIDNECDRMARIVKDLLQLSNLDYKKTKWNKKNLSIEKLLKDVVMKVELQAKEKEHTIFMNVEENMPNIVVDKDGIEQVILNVLSNSIKYTPNGGNIQILAREENDKVVITVKDDGIGIPEEDQDRIFERFYRVDKARSRELGGTGLGLSIAKQIVEAHGGDIDMKSKYNEGTEVSIILPEE